MPEWFTGPKGRVHAGAHAARNDADAGTASQGEAQDGAKRGVRRSVRDEVRKDRRKPTRRRADGSAKAGDDAKAQVGTQVPLGAGAVPGSPGALDAADIPGVQGAATGRIYAAEGIDVVRRAELASQITQPLPRITAEDAQAAWRVNAGARPAADAPAASSGAAMGAGAHHTDRMGRTVAADAAAPGTADATASADAAAAAAAARRAAVAAVMGSAGDAPGIPGASKAASAPDAPDAAASESGCGTGGGKGGSGGGGVRPRSGGSDAAGDAAEKDGARRSFIRTEDGRIALWFKVVCAVVATLLALAALVGIVLAWVEWGMGDDAQDIQGQWTAADGGAAVSISADRIALTSDAVYSYYLDAGEKSITFSFVDKQGGGHYRFSLDRRQVAIVEGDGLDQGARIWADFAWILAAAKAMLLDNQVLSPAAGMGEGADVTLLTKVDDAGVQAEEVQPEATEPSIVIDRTGG